MEHEWTDANGSRWKADQQGVWFFTIYGYWELTHPSLPIGSEFLRLAKESADLRAGERQRQIEMLRDILLAAAHDRVENRTDSVTSYTTAIDARLNALRKEAGE